MIKYIGARRQYQVAHKAVPRTAEFKLLREILEERGRHRSDLVRAAAAALDRVVGAHPAPRADALTPDALYDAALGDTRLIEGWENTFGGAEKGRDLFGLVAWTYFFNHGSTWLAHASGTPGLGKRGWTFQAESAAREPHAAPARRALRAAPEPYAAPALRGVSESTGRLALNQCVLWTSMDRVGRVVDGPRDTVGLIVEQEYLVRFKPRFDEPPPEIWIIQDNLEATGDDGPCAGIGRVR